MKTKKNYMCGFVSIVNERMNDWLLFWTISIGFTFIPLTKTPKLFPTYRYCSCYASHFCNVCYMTWLVQTNKHATYNVLFFCCWKSFCFFFTPIWLLKYIHWFGEFILKWFLTFEWQHSPNEIILDNAVNHSHTYIAISIKIP